MTKGKVVVHKETKCDGLVNGKGISYEEEVRMGREERKEGGCASAVPVKASDRGGLFSAAPGVNGSAGACHSEGQHGTISDDDGGTDLCQDAEPSCQSKHSALWDDKDGP